MHRILHILSNSECNPFKSVLKKDNCAILFQTLGYFYGRVTFIISKAN